MNLPLFIARRYLFARKKQNIINIISGISVSGIVLGTMAIIIVISVLNGFNKLVGLFFSSFDPDLKITAVEGKMFDTANLNSEQIKAIPGVIHYAEVIEEVALLKYGNQQFPAVVKGVPANYPNYTNIDNLVVEGDYTLKKEGINYAVVGYGVAYNLGIGLTFIDPIHIYVPKKGKQISINPTKSINHNYIQPAGIFSVLEDIDSKYILVDFDYATDLYGCAGQISSIELGLAETADVKKIQEKIKQILGTGFHVKNKYQQHDLVFKTMKSEKWAVYLILVFILILASGNMIGNLTMLYIDKKDDIMILQSMGATSGLIHRIFLFEGWLISLCGAIIGTALGIFVCWLQIKYEIIALPAGFAVSAYPVQIIFTDVILAFTAVLIIGFFASWFPLKFISKKHIFNSVT